MVTGNLAEHESVALQYQAPGVAVQRYIGWDKKRSVTHNKALVWRITGSIQTTSRTNFMTGNNLPRLAAEDSQKKGWDLEEALAHHCMEWLEDPSPANLADIMWLAEAVSLSRGFSAAVHERFSTLETRLTLTGSLKRNP